MAFVRTASGLDNQHLFHNVDLIVFVEGGVSLSKAQIDAGIYNAQSIDTIFWSKVFEKYCNEKTVKFKAIGSKTAILKVAQDIISNNLTTVYAAMDQEFDTVLAKIYKHNRILYTFGYSWENDVWNENVIKAILDATTAINIDAQLVIKPFAKFLKDIKFSVYADGYLFSKGSSFFPRPTNHLRIIECRTNMTTSVKKAEVTNLIQSFNLTKTNVYSFGYRKKIIPQKYCYGHLLGDFCKFLINYLLRSEFNVNSLGGEVVRRLGINYFFNNLSPEVNQHYMEQFN